MPLSAQDEKYFGKEMTRICDARLVKDKDGWYHTHPKFLPYPSRNVSIREIIILFAEYIKFSHLRTIGGSKEDKFVLVELKPNNASRMLEEIELSRVLFEVYEGAVVCDV